MITSQVLHAASPKLLTNLLKFSSHNIFSFLKAVVWFWNFTAGLKLLEPLQQVKHSSKPFENFHCSWQNFTLVLGASAGIPGPVQGPYVWGIDRALPTPGADLDVCFSRCCEERVMVMSACETAKRRGSVSDPTRPWNRTDNATVMKTTKPSAHFVRVLMFPSVCYSVQFLSSQGGHTVAF